MPPVRTNQPPDTPDNPQEQCRIDSIRLDLADPKVSKETTEEGYLRARDVVVSRAGVFKYTNPDGSTRRELRPPEEVFDAESMASFANKPLVNGHPTGLVTPDNVKRLQVGHLGDKLYRDGSLLRASTVTITDGRAIEDARAGKSQLSLGYVQRLEPTPGNPRHDGIQRLIRGNHISLEHKGRAGALASLPRFDGASYTTMGDIAPPASTGGSIMPRMNVGGVVYEVPDALITPIKELMAEADTVRADKAAADERASALEAEKATLTAALEKANGERMDADAITEKVQAEVAARLDVAEKLKAHLPEGTEVAKSTVDELRKAALKTLLPTLTTDGWGSEALETNLATALAMAEDRSTKRADAAEKAGKARAAAVGAASAPPELTGWAKVEAARNKNIKRGTGLPHNLRSNGGE